MKNRYEGIQNILHECGESGCLFLSLLSIVEETTGVPADLISAIRIAQEKGWLADDFTVNDSVSILVMLTGYRWTREIVPFAKFDPAKVADNDYTIAKWVRGKITHFRRRGWDVYKNSQTVKYGTCESIYVYTCTEEA